MTNVQMPPMPVANEEIPEGKGMSYWQVVRRAYFRRVLHWVAVFYIAALAFVAVFVPFIANGRPYTAVVDGVRQYPLFKSLTRSDLAILVGAAGALACALTIYLVKPGDDPDAAGRKRRRIMAVIAGITLLGAGAIGLFKKDYNDLLHREDYRQLTPDYTIKDAIFPPLAWGFADAEYPFQESSQYENPSPRHMLGTDGSGRDTLSRLLWSARVVFGISLISQIVAMSIGVSLGSLMGYFGGTVDILGNRFMELVDSIPTFFLLIIFVAVFGRQIGIIMLILGLVSWTGIARFVRADFLRLRNTDFVQAAIAGGMPLRSVLFRHILPNALTPVLVNVTFGIAGAVTLESSLSYLGLGVEPPTASWGSMLDEAGDPGSIFHFWLAMMPGIMIFITIFAYNIIGEGLRDAIDPKLNKVQ